MKRFYKNYVLFFSVILMFFGSTAISFADENLSSEEEQIVAKLKQKPLNGFFGFTFANAVPQGEFFDSLKNSAQGFSIFGGYDMDPVPVIFGAELDFLFFGGEEKYLPVYDLLGKPLKDDDTVETQSMIIPVNVFIRLQPNLINMFYPYVEGIAGINFLNVDYEYKSNYYKNSSQDRFDVSFIFGFGAGLNIKLVDFIQLPNSHTQMLFNIGLRYLKGTEADFATVKIEDNGNPDFKDFTTPTDMIMFLAGITFRF